MICQLRTSNKSGGSTAGYSWNATFDNADRLQTWNRTNGTSRDYNLDLIGNWDSVSRDGVLENRTYNDAHELITSGSESLSYDAKGQLTENADFTFIWDIDGHLQTATNKNSIETVSFTYDALGRRTEKRALDVNTLYSSCGQKVCEEYDSVAGGAYNHARTYVHATYIDDIVAKYDAGSAGVPRLCEKLFTSVAFGI
ncbi:MAG: hypothetical protein MK132_19245 [Lentisphaerales bacterium]|nr:hypothetical protein [Lentisphaerales bacterium]